MIIVIIIVFIVISASAAFIASSVNNSHLEVHMHAYHNCRCRDFAFGSRNPSARRMQLNPVDSASRS